MSEYDQSCYNPSLDRVSDGAQHSKAWEEYKTYGTAGRNEDEIEEKNSSDRRFAEEEEEEIGKKLNANEFVVSSSSSS